MSEELKPCPFCRSHDVELRQTVTEAVVACNNCNARTGTAFLGADEASSAYKLKELAAAWNTRPAANVEAEPVAWLQEHERGERVLSWQLLTEADKKYGWTETPLYPASALEAARREALEEAAKVCDEWDENSPYRSRATAIRALKDQANG